MLGSEGDKRLEYCYKQTKKHVCNKTFYQVYRSKFDVLNTVFFVFRVASGVCVCVREAFLSK